MKVLIQRYVNRNAKPPFEFYTVDTFEFDEKELDEFPQNSAMYCVLSGYISRMKYGFPLQFWSILDKNTICAVLDDRPLFGLDNIFE